jgi:tetratricopeptide (TPR) repeat protein/DNA-binding winged helix-turn-helix (wHTH) protein
MSIYRAEGLEISPRRREVLFAGAPISLRPKSFDVLIYLIRHRDRVVPKDELLRELWPGAAVSENSVAQCVIELRKSLGDDAREPRCIRTMGKAGYRFVADVEEIQEAMIETPAPPAPTRRPVLVWGGLVSTTALLSWAALRGRRTPDVPGPESLALSMTSNLRAAHLYLEGVELARHVHEKEALARFREAVRLDPAFAMAHARIGFVLAITGSNLAEGLPHLEKAFQLTSGRNDLSRLYILAWYAESKQDYRGAMRAYREVISRFPKETDARQRLARILIGEGQYLEAEKTLLEAIALDPESPLPHNTLCSVHLISKQFDRAVAEGEKFVALLPGEPNALDSLGLALEARNDFETAEATYRQALDVKPGFWVARVHLAGALFRQGRYNEARAEGQRFLDATETEAGKDRAHNLLAQIARRAGDLQLAKRLASNWGHGSRHETILIALSEGRLADADRLLAAMPQQVDRGQRGSRRFALYLQGERAMAGGDTSAALRLFEEALEQRTPFYALEWYEDCLASACLRTGRFQRAIAEYQRVVQTFPRLADSWHGLGKAFQATGQYAEAQQAFARVLEIWKRGDAAVPERLEATRALRIAPREISGI